MNKNKAILIAVALFKSYPTVNKFQITADGQGFEGKHDAEAHAAFLDKKNPVVFEVNRDDKAEAEKQVKEPVSAEQAAVNKYSQMVDGFEKALAKAVANKKPAIQKLLDSAKESLSEAEKTLTEKK